VGVGCQEEDDPSASVKVCLGRSCALAPNAASNVDRALRLYQGIKATDHAIGLRLWESVLLSRSGRHEEALDLLRRTSEDPSTDPLAGPPPRFVQLVIRAFVYTRSNHTTEARQFLFEANRNWETDEAQSLHNEVDAAPRSVWTDRVAFLTLRREAEATLATKP
jgi:hypothetical protein